MPFKQLPYVKPNHHLFSSQKSGRTWVRMILARVLVHVGINPKKKEMVPSFHSSCEGVCRKHDPSKMNVIFLYRDPRDCIVSRYFEITRRRLHPAKSKDPTKAYNNTLSEYIRRDDQYGIASIIAYMNEWIEGKDRFNTFMSTSYEHLHYDAVAVMSEILEFLGVDCPEDKIEESVEYSSFENMRKVEVSGVGNLLQKYHGTFGKRHKESDPESFRTRKGKIGSFKEYLNAEDIEFMNNEMKSLDDYFGYRTL